MTCGLSFLLGFSVKYTTSIICWQTGHRISAVVRFFWICPQYLHPKYRFPFSIVYSSRFDFFLFLCNNANTRYCCVRTYVVDCRLWLVSIDPQASQFNLQARTVLSRSYVNVNVHWRERGSSVVFRQALLF